MRLFYFSTAKLNFRQFKRICRSRIKIPQNSNFQFSEQSERYAWNIVQQFGIYVRST